MRAIVAAFYALIWTATAASAQDRGRVAIIPTQVVNAAQANGPRVTEALRSSLERRGFTVIDQGQVDRLVRSNRAHPARPITTAQLARMRDELGADYMVYPRLLNVGVGLNSDRLQANVIVNVQGNRSQAFVHTRQVGQLLASRDRRQALRIVMTRGEANEAIRRIMEPFYAKRSGAGAR